MGLRVGCLWYCIICPQQNSVIYTLLNNTSLSCDYVVTFSVLCLSNFPNRLLGVILDHLDPHFGTVKTGVRQISTVVVVVNKYFTPSKRDRVTERLSIFDPVLVPPKFQNERNTLLHLNLRPRRSYTVCTPPSPGLRTFTTEKV